MTNKEFKDLKKQLLFVADNCYKNGINAMPFVRGFCMEKFHADVKFIKVYDHHFDGQESGLCLIMFVNEYVIDRQSEQEEDWHTGNFIFEHCSLKWL